jgi:hypothetical protein
MVRGHYDETAHDPEQSGLQVCISKPVACIAWMQEKNQGQTMPLRSRPADHIPQGHGQALRQQRQR